MHYKGGKSADDFWTSISDARLKMSDKVDKVEQPQHQMTQSKNLDLDFKPKHLQVNQNDIYFELDF
jgi:hypothetical protein